MLTRILGQILFTILHFIVSILVATQNVYQRLWVKKIKFCKGEVTKSDIQIILQHVPMMKKKPKHLVVLVDTNHHSLSDLACLVIWNLVAGIPYLSFYDREGFMKTNEDKFFHEVERNKKGIPGCIKWHNKPDLNGYTNGIPAYTIFVNIFSSEDSHLKIAQCIREIAKGNISLKLGPEEITAQEFDTVLKPFYPDIPEPELAVYTGPVCCTNGLLPWQIRLTEFVRLSLDHKISVDGYVGALYKYNKCDQRFGK